LDVGYSLPFSERQRAMIFRMVDFPEPLFPYSTVTGEKTKGAINRLRKTL
jgi:hypothetical protein